MNETTLFWIGIQESEITDVKDLFMGSITMFGSGKNGNYAFDKEKGLRFNYNLDNPLWTEFVNKSAENVIAEFHDCKFLLYYPMDAKDYSHELKQRIIAINDLHSLDILDNKFKCREWLCNEVPTLPQQFVSGKKLIKLSERLFEDENEYVVQGEYSCGGSGTWFYSQNNYKRILKYFDRSKTYSLAPYIKNNIPVNVHIVVYKDDILLFPGSVQLISLKSDIFEYTGADFITFRSLPQKIRNKITKYSQIIGKRLQHSGYRGVYGIDYIATASEVYFMEINPRFQSSTILLNKALKEFNYPSMQHLHLDAFKNEKCNFKPEKFKVNYSYCKFVYGKKDRDKLLYLSNCAQGNDEFEYLDDGLSSDTQTEEHTYLFKIIFKRNVCAISQYFTLTKHPDLKLSKSIVDFGDIQNYLLQLKIMLLSHGIRIEKKSLTELEKSKKLNHEEFDALDMVLLDKIYINVPYRTNLSELSPFNIRIYKNELWLYYFNLKLLKIKLRFADKRANLKTKNGNLYGDIAYLGNDRLRVFHRFGCYFKDSAAGCRFCDVVNDSAQLDLAEIKEVVDTYKFLPEINHFMIGGGSRAPQDDFEFICELAEYLKKDTDKPIYLMSLPPKNTETLEKLKKSGITEVAFNIEIYDRSLAQKYMPGKGCIPLSQYLNAFKSAVKLWGSGGNVRTIFIVGLESKHSLLEGIEAVCKIGVSPILSLFKPIENTELSNLLPPPDEEILEIINRTSEICDKYGLEIGPACRFCEDNTLKITV